MTDETGNRAGVVTDEAVDGSRAVKHYTGCLCSECTPWGVGYVPGFGLFPIPAPSVFAGGLVVDESNPPPTRTDQRPTWELVIEDMQRRDNVGRARYGTPLQPSNGRDSLVDAYEEALDLCVYLKNEIVKRRMEKARVQLTDSELQEVAKLVAREGAIMDGAMSKIRHALRDCGVSDPTSPSEVEP